MEILNWEEAPVDATHGVIIQGNFRGWRCVSLEDQKVFDWEAGEWVDHFLTVPVEEYLEINKEFLEERPAPPVEAELPDGKVWPEGADFYYPPVDVFFRAQLPAYMFVQRGIWHGGTNALIEDYAKRKETIHRFPGAQPKAAHKKEEPPKKRTVGWWS